MSFSSKLNTASQAFYKTFERSTYKNLSENYGNWAYLLIPLRVLVGLLSASLYLFRVVARTLFNPYAAIDRPQKFVLSWLLTAGIAAATFFSWGAVAAAAEATALAIGFTVLGVSAPVIGGILTGLIFAAVIALAFVAIKYVASGIEQHYAKQFIHPEAKTSVRRLSRSGMAVVFELKPLLDKQHDETLTDLLEGSARLETLYQSLKTAYEDGSYEALAELGVQADIGQGITIQDSAFNIMSDIKQLNTRLAEMMQAVKTADSQNFTATKTKFDLLKADIAAFVSLLPHSLTMKMATLDCLRDYELQYEGMSASIVKKTDGHVRPSSLHIEKQSSFRTPPRTPGDKSAPATPRTPRSQRRVQPSNDKVASEGKIVLLAEDSEGYYEPTFNSSGSDADGRQSRMSNSSSDGSIVEAVSFGNALLKQAPTSTSPAHASDSTISKSTSGEFISISDDGRSRANSTDGSGYHGGSDNTGSPDSGNSILKLQPGKNR